MWEICDDEGKKFNSTGEQKTYIRNFFANSFKKPENEPANLEGCIETFLGPEILDHPLTLILKLSDDERIRLEADLTADELDISLDGANCKSASGIDGISTAFIKRFWFIFRNPLLKYASTAFTRGSLTQSFKTAIIKLIPKKGDSSNIKKWRPISLLSCLYKILSRAINNRLKSVHVKSSERFY